MDDDQPKDPWRKILLLFIIFVLLVGCTNTPRVKNDDFITAWTIAVSVVGLCIGIVFSLVLRSLAKSIDAQRMRPSECDVEAAAVPSLPPSYSKCCEASVTSDGLPSYEQAVASISSNPQNDKSAGVHLPVNKY